MLPAFFDRSSTEISLNKNKKKQKNDKGKKENIMQIK
jgi:hypothetical protein